MTTYLRFSIQRLRDHKRTLVMTVYVNMVDRHEYTFAVYMFSEPSVQLNDKQMSRPSNCSIMRFHKYTAKAIIHIPITDRSSPEVRSLALSALSDICHVTTSLV